MPATKIDINLLSQVEIQRKPLNKFLRWFLTYGRYIIISTHLIVLIAFFSRFKLDQELSDLHSKIDEKVNIIETLSPIEKNIRITQDKIQTIAQLEKNRTLYLDILDDLAKQTKENAIINRLSFSQNHLTINGKVLNNTALNSFLTYLRKNKHFSQINLEQITIGQDDSFTFRISLQIN